MKKFSIKWVLFLCGLFIIFSSSYTFAQCTTELSNAIVNSWLGTGVNSCGTTVDTGIYVAENDFFEAVGTASNPNPKTSTDLTYKKTLIEAQMGTKYFSKVFLAALRQIGVSSTVVKTIAKNNRLFINAALQYALVVNINITGGTLQQNETIVYNNLVNSAANLAIALTEINPSYANNFQFSGDLYYLAITITQLAQSYRTTLPQTPADYYANLQVYVNDITALILGASGCSG